MQEIVLFIEPNVDACITSGKIGTLLVNRFSVDKEASAEIQKEYLNKEEKQLKEGVF